MHKIYYALFFVTVFTLRAQPVSVGFGQLSGTVVNERNEPLPGVTVYLPTTRQGVATDVDGRYALDNVPAGLQTVVASLVGYTTQQRQVNLPEGGAVTLHFTFGEAQTQLQEIEIFGRRETGYTTEASFVGTKTATPLKDVPQSISVVTKELMQDQQAIRLGEIVRNVSGVNQFSHYDDYTIRGFRVGSGSTQLINGLRVTSGFWKQPLTNYLERVEVIKGPASALFGNSSPGGTINRVTKKPLTEERRAVSFTVGSFDTYRALADVTGPLNEAKTVLYRLNLGYENAQSFRDLQFDENLVVAPSVSFVPSDRTQLNFDLVVNRTRTRLDRGQAVFGDAGLYSVPISKSLNQINDRLQEDNYFATLSLTHRFSERLRFNASYLKYGYHEELTEHRSANRYAVDSAGNALPNLVEMQVFLRDRRRFVDNLTSYFVADFNLGPLEHQLLVGYDYIQEKLPLGGSQSTAAGYRTADGTGALPRYDPTKSSRYAYDAQGRPVPNVPHFDLTASNPYTIADMGRYFYTTRQIDPTFYRVHGVYAQDQIRYGRLQALLGLRQEFYTDLVNYRAPNAKRVTQQALIPRVGLVFALTPRINAYATWVRGYEPQGAGAIANPNAGGPFDPLTSRLWEGGLKSDWYGGRLSVTAAAYDIRLRNVLYNANDPDNPDRLTQIGAESSRGVEFDVVGSITPAWSLLVNYAYNDARIVEGNETIDANRQKPNAPRHQGNVWTKYVLARGPLAGVGAGLGSNFVTARSASLNQDNVLPGYVLLNAALYYRVERFQVQVNVNNVTDQTHWVGGYDFLRLFPGAPRNWLLNVAYTF